MPNGADMKTDQSQLTAETVAGFMSKHDAFGRLLGMQVESVEPGRAVVSLVVTEQLINGLGICHGGVTFSLADTAFAYACNSCGQRTVALTCNINFTRSAAVGQKLRAIAEEQLVTGKTGVYDVKVVDEQEQTIAVFRGTAYRFKQPTVPE
jgi:acyl-CoA thioesterase